MNDKYYNMLSLANPAPVLTMNTKHDVKRKLSHSKRNNLRTNIFLSEIILEELQIKLLTGDVVSQWKV